MANDAVIDTAFDMAIGMVEVLAEMDDRPIFVTALQLAARVTKTKFDDYAVAAAVKIANALGPNKAAAVTFINWLRDRAKGIFSAVGELPLKTEEEFEAACLLADYFAATNSVEA